MLLEDLRQLISEIEAKADAVAEKLDTAGGSEEYAIIDAHHIDLLVINQRIAEIIGYNT